MQRRKALFGNQCKRSERQGVATIELDSPLVLYRPGTFADWYA